MNRQMGSECETRACHLTQRQIDQSQHASQGLGRQRERERERVSERVREKERKQDRIFINNSSRCEIVELERRIPPIPIRVTVVEIVSVV